MRDLAHAVHFTSFPMRSVGSRTRLMRFEFEVHEDGLRPEWDPATLTEERLRYYCFTGDVAISDRTGHIRTSWRWVPVADFALAIWAVAQEVRSPQSSPAIFEFTESPAAIRFERRGEMIHITATFSDEVLDVPIADFFRAVNQLYRDVRGCLIERIPRLAANPALPDRPPLDY